MARQNQTLSKSRKEMTESWRERLRVSEAIHALGETVKGDLEPSAVRMKAIELTLKKALPDLSATDLTSKGDSISFDFTVKRK